MKKKVLIIGNSAKEYALAKRLSENCEVFVAPGNDVLKEFAECLDIRETSSQELLEFAMENGIDMTIPVSSLSLSSDIVKLFNKHNMQIFAPDTEAAILLNDKFATKKLMYKLGVPTPRFGIFEKQNIAGEYIKGIKQPFVLKNNNPSSAVIITAANSSKLMLDSMLMEKDSKVLIEDYVYGTPFGFYAITDGCNALPIGSSILYKHSLEGDGGQLTSGMGSCCPNYKLSFRNEEYLMNEVIYPTLDYIEKNGSPYLGIIGVNGILTDEGNVKILGYQSFMQDSDCAGILALIDMDLYHLFESCIIGSFSDEVGYIEQKNMSSVSVVLACRNNELSENVIHNTDIIDEDLIVSYTNNVIKNKYLEFEAKNGPVMILTALAGTPALSSEKVYEEISNIDFCGMKYRHDVCRKMILC